MFEYLWDFGTLGPQEERSYIEAMSSHLFHEDPSWRRVVANLISMSQKYVTDVLPDCLLSLRDVKRCVDLIEWFNGHLKYRNKARAKQNQQRKNGSSYYTQKDNGQSGTLDAENMRLRAVLNALAVSYHCRLPDHKLRGVGFLLPGRHPSIFQLLSSPVSWPFGKVSIPLTISTNYLQHHTGLRQRADAAIK